MKNNIKQLYKVFDKYSPFNIPNMCKGCPVLCAREKNVRWLLDGEVGHLKNLLKISREKDAYFFEGGPCPNLRDGKCKIYEMRPFECRLNPLSVYEINDELYWILYTKCMLINKLGKNFVKKLAELAEKIEPYIDEKIRENFRRISSAIKEFDPLVEGRDFRILRRFYKS